MKSNSKNVHVDILIIYGLSVCIVTLVLATHVIEYYKFRQKKVVYPKSVVDNRPLFDKSAFSTIKIEGKAYVVYDTVTHEVIASKNEQELLPLASVTKVMMAVSSTLHKKKDEKIIITPKSIEDGYDLGLKNKQVWDLSELLKYTLVFSSNDGAEAIADSFGGKDIFVNQMNGDAKNLGLNLTFTDPAGRDLNGKIGGKGTVLEVAKLFSIARKNIPEILDATTKKRETVTSSFGKISGVPNTNQDIETLSGAEASKTGYTDMAGGNLGVIVDISVGHPVVIVVLGSTKTGRFEDMDTLYKALRSSLSKSEVSR
jgi:D-alanyl-D-alanine endopeptidase (penicillin-binding protein 7)